MSDSAIHAWLAAFEKEIRAKGLSGERAFQELMERARQQPIGAETLNLAYERMFPELFRGRNGQFFTPPPLIQWVIDQVGIQSDERVLDPTCGGGGFLVEAARRGARVIGVERDPLLAELAVWNVGRVTPKGKIYSGDGFALKLQRVDVVLANPPFSILVSDPHVLAQWGHTEPVAADVLLVQALSTWLKPGGRAGIILPWSFLTGRPHAAVRERLDTLGVSSIIALPEGIFRPFGGAGGRAAIVILGPGQRRYTKVIDPGWNIRSQRWQPTPGDEGSLSDPTRWTPLGEGEFVPPMCAASSPTTPLSRFAKVVEQRMKPQNDGQETVQLIELADVDSRTGEVVPTDPVAVAEIRGVRAKINGGDVILSRLRPELGKVARAPSGQWWGSPEWIALRPIRLADFLTVVLRTPAWRSRLMTDGQVRPRITSKQVIANPIPWPGTPIATRIDRLRQSLREQQEQNRRQQFELQRLVDQFATGELTAKELEGKIDEKFPAPGVTE